MAPHSAARIAAQHSSRLLHGHDVPIEITGKSTIKFNNEDVCETPSRGTLTFDQAESWYADKVGKIAEWLVKSPTKKLANRVTQAWQLRSELREASKSTLLDPALANKFIAAHPLLSIDRLRAELKTQYSGDPLNNAVIRRLQEMTGESVCFVAGTPVWTDKGLVPIEQIKVGDLVLSRSDTTGEQTYKRVLKTFSTEDQEIRTVSFEGYLNGEESEYLYEFVFATKEHPFYVKEYGWQVVERMCRNCERWQYFERANGGVVLMGHPIETLGFPVLQLSDRKDHGFVFMNAFSEEEHGFSMWFDGKTQTDNYHPGFHDDRVENFRTLYHGATLSCNETLFIDDLVEDVWDRTEFKATVFNIEVEDFHTYFVGELGVWVHNACTLRQPVSSLTAIPVDAARFTPLPETLMFHSKADASGYLEREFKAGNDLYGQIHRVRAKSANAWDNAVFGSLKGAEYWIGFRNLDAIQLNRGFLNGRAYEGMKGIRDTLYAIDRKTNYFSQIGLRNGAISDVLTHQLWKDVLAMEAFEALAKKGGVANFKELRVAYSFGGGMARRKPWINSSSRYYAGITSAIQYSGSYSVLNIKGYNKRTKQLAPMS